MSAGETRTVKSACNLCSINCGIEIELGGEGGRQILKVKGDKDNPSSRGYLCNKATRLNYYQNSPDRLDSPLRRREDGTYERVDWDTAIAEIAARLGEVKARHGGDKILFLGGGGQGNHLGGLYADGVLRHLGVKYRSNALAQEKTGEFWVSGKMFGGGPHGDFENCEVAFFVGKNPWQSHGFARTRVILNAIKKDPKRSMIVIDPCVTETAQMADFHLQLKPGTDSWLLTALVAVLIQEGIEDREFIAKRVSGFEEIRDHFGQVDLEEHSRICGVPLDLIRAAARRMASASSTAFFEDLGLQQNVNSTVSSYLHRMLWVLTGNIGKKGGNNIAVSLLKVTDAGRNIQGKKPKNAPRPKKTSPVLGSRIITGLIPCNEVPEEILTDHPDRFRAAIIESHNPVHSYANAERMREAIRALEFSVVVDVAWTETARQADYVLPASSVFEKHECVFFQVEYPENFFQIRQPMLAPLEGTLPEPEIYTRLLEAMGGFEGMPVGLLKGAAGLGRRAYAAAFAGAIALNPKVLKAAANVLYRTLGPTLDGGKSAAVAPFWALAHRFVRGNRQNAANAGFGGSAWQAGEALFDALKDRASGVIFTRSEDYEESWDRMTIASGKINLHLAELFPSVQQLDESQLAQAGDPEFPLILAAGQRRNETSNTIIRDSSWDTKNKVAALYMHPLDAASQGLEEGDRVKIVTKTGEAETLVELTEQQPQGAIALPNGLGLDFVDATGETRRVGASCNELTSTSDRDGFAGTPWHKFVPARVERIAA